VRGSRRGKEGSSIGYLEGLLGGFTGRKREYEAEELRKAELANAREAKVYEALISSPDPEIQALATAGLLESARGPQKKGGIQGWLGQMEQSPFLGRIQELINTPVTTTEEVPGTPTLPSRSLIGAIATPPGEVGSAAQPAGSPTEGAPLQPLTTIEQPSRPTPGTTRQVTKPRQVFLTPEEAMLRQKRAAAQGDVEGEVAGLIAAGYTEEEARALVSQKYQRRYSGGTDRSIFGEILQADGTWVSGSVVFDPATGKHYDTATGEPVLGFRRNTNTGSKSFGTDREAISLEPAFGGIPFAQQSPEMVARINAEAIRRAGVKAGEVTVGRGEAAARIPLDRGQQAAELARLATVWDKEIQPLRTMQRAADVMDVGVRRYGEGDRIGGSQAVLVTFQKILDPNSVVRESEYARSGASLSLMQRMQGMYDRYIGQWDPEKQQWIGGGAGVPENELREMAKTAHEFVEQMAKYSTDVRDRTYRTAKAFDLDPALVIGGREDLTAAEAAYQAYQQQQGRVATPPPGGTPPPSAGTPPPTGATAAPSAPAAPPGGGLDQPAGGGWFVDENGNLIWKPVGPDGKPIGGGV